MERLLRLSVGANRDPDIDRWLTKQQDELHFIASRWFARMRECGDDVLELMHDGCPVACVEDAPFGYVNIFKAHVNVGFFSGASLDDPSHVLVGTGKRMRHVKMMPFSELNSAAMSALIVVAYRNVKTQLRLEPGRNFKP